MLVESGPFTSVSTSKDAIRDFGEQLWKLTQPKVTDDGHVLVMHEQLLHALRALLHDNDDRTRELAARALPRSIRRREALVDWRYNVDGIERKDRISWAERYVSAYFTRC